MGNAALGARPGLFLLFWISWAARQAGLFTIPLPPRAGSKYAAAGFLAVRRRPWRAASSHSIFFAILRLDVTRAGVLPPGGFEFFAFSALARAHAGAGGGDDRGNCIAASCEHLPRRSGTAKMGRRCPSARAHLPGPPARPCPGRGGGGGWGCAARQRLGVRPDSAMRPLGPRQSASRLDGAPSPRPCLGATGRGARGGAALPRRRDRRRPCPVPAGTARLLHNCITRPCIQCTP